MAEAATIALGLRELVASGGPVSGSHCCTKQFRILVHCDRGTAYSGGAHVDVFRGGCSWWEQCRHAVRPGKEVYCGSVGLVVRLRTERE
jgi:hypothetical protein